MTARRAISSKMRLRIIQAPRSSCIDGVELSRFMVGHQYEVGNTFGALLLAEGWAEPVDDPAPALVISLRELDADDGPATSFGK
jgi:hypothetical protein